MSAVRQIDMLTCKSVMNDRHGKHFAMLVSVMVVICVSTEMLLVQTWEKN